MNYIKLAVIAIVVILLLILFIYTQNNVIVTSVYKVTDIRIPKKFNNFKIVQVSDLHNKNFGNRLYEKIKALSPDIIVITGDLLDRRRPDIKTAVEIVENLTGIAPVYYITGNHEELSVHRDEIVSLVQEAGAIVLENNEVVLEKENEKIRLIGVRDPAYTQDEKTYHKADNSEYMRDILSQFNLNDDSFNILLSHRPELFSIYSEKNIGLVMSGHAHGGQIRLPLIGAIYAPHQGIFPHYAEGMHCENDTALIVSRGLGNSRFPIRLFNCPEIVVAKLYNE